MITFLRGKLIEKNHTDVVIECHGVGYFVNISLHTFSLLPEGESIMLYTYLHIKEDAHTLYGFAHKSEREIFKLLISVSGVGTSIARTMLSSLEPSQVKQAIATGDVKTIQGVKGIGAKTAQRVILDLKDKILKVVSNILENSKEHNYTNNFKGAAGKSIAYISDFKASNGFIRVWCTDWDKKTEKEKNWYF